MDFYFVFLIFFSFTVNILLFEKPNKSLIKETKSVTLNDLIVNKKKKEKEKHKQQYYHQVNNGMNSLRE